MWKGNGRSLQPPEEYDKLTEAEKAETKPIVTANHFKTLQSEVATLKATVLSLQTQIFELKHNLTKKKGGK
jgi:hypothetical protein